MLQARAEFERLRDEPDKARQALDEALTEFYGGEGLLHASWMHLQHAHLSLEVGDLAEAARRLDLAREGFSESNTQFGIDSCAALDARLRAANGLLTGER